MVQSLHTPRPTLHTLTIGSYHSLETDITSCFVYLRQHEQQRLLMALMNFSLGEQTVKLFLSEQEHILCSTHMDREETFALSELHLYANEGLLIDLV